MKARCVVVIALLGAASLPVTAAPFNCITAKEGCPVFEVRIPLLPHPKAFLKFETCTPSCDPEWPDDPLKPGQCLKTCDRANKKGWETHFIPVPEGEVCNYNNATIEAQRWIDLHDQSLRLGGWGCADYESADI